MTINQIAAKLNDLAISDEYEIAKLPELRKKYLGKKQLPGNIFTPQTIFDEYAFHHGGRDEMQFNFGRDYIDDNECTRFALCISLNASRSLPNPVDYLHTYKISFNKCINLHPDFFEGIEMWYYQDDERYGNFMAQIIPDNWFQQGTFICIGFVIKKPYNKLNDFDLIEILNGFDKLLPIYQYCVLNSPSILSKERRISKICWNDNNWMYPSGLEGKSIDSNSYERKMGYGHEEWLFDFDKLVDGYHYGLLQPVQNGRENFLNKSFDVKLYSHNSDKKENLWIGSIKNLEVVSNEDAKEVYKIYKSNGWIDEMALQIKKINGNSLNFKKLKPHHCFNVRFKPEDAKLDIPYKIVDDFNGTIGTYHYQFVHDKIKHSASTRSKKNIRQFEFKNGKSHKSLSNRVSTREKKVVQSEPIHDKIQEILYENLISIYGEENVGMENDTGLLTRIDVSLNTPEGIILYEVKSYPSVMISIRAALGQLLEYAYFPNPIPNLKEMIIVSQVDIDPENQEYLEFIRKTTSLKIYYQSIDIHKRTISAKS